jgi:hypothetical protein
MQRNLKTLIDAKIRDDPAGQPASAESVERDQRLSVKAAEIAKLKELREAKEADQRSPQGKTIMENAPGMRPAHVVEDEALILMMLQNTLLDAGWTPLVASDLESALVLAQQESFRLCLSRRPA